MQCPKCKGQAEVIPWHQGLPGEGSKAGASAARSSYKYHHGHPVAGLLGLGITLGTVLVKATLSTAYQCRRCGHAWRQW